MTIPYRPAHHITGVHLLKLKLKRKSISRGISSSGSGRARCAGPVARSACGQGVVIAIARYFNVTKSR